MDVSEYVANDPRRLDQLARGARMQASRIRSLVDDPRQPVRYMTAMRLCAASGGMITMAGMSRRGDMPGESLFDGPLGQRMAQIASTGPDVAARLSAAGVRREQFNSMMLSGWVPRPENMRRISEAFDGALSREDFVGHARWRAGDAS